MHTILVSIIALNLSVCEYVLRVAGHWTFAKHGILALKHDGRFPATSLLTTNPSFGIDVIDLFQSDKHRFDEIS
jgi:hypothetical protein